MHDFIPGQRWINDADAQMGLGTILDVEHRTVTVIFMSTGETLTYAKQSAPLTRVTFAIGDTVHSHEGWSLAVESVEEHEGLLTYIGTRDNGKASRLEEIELDNFIQLSRPSERLFTGQIDQAKWFELRYQTLLHENRLAHSDLRGLTGVRTSLIPHQLYIAHEVANRYAPRVLLADEVGLGKTIEAGLILHHQLLTERARRILIIVPETLVHQWLVEMLRRFNLFFSIFNEERCLGIEEGEDFNNPFHAEQLVLCSLDFLVNDRNRRQQALAGEWDLMVVDEAHHLQWSEKNASPEYDLIEKLAAVTKGVLLLTATPEQLGKASHFARLRLLDPDRFSNFDHFIEEEKSYVPVAQAVENLLNNQPFSDTTRQTLLSTLNEGDNKSLLDTLKKSDLHDETNIEARQQLIEHLLDRHGTGRVLFRNTRSAVKGFPQRNVTAYPLPLPEQYNSQHDTDTSVALLLCPEHCYQSQTQKKQLSWIQFDPRIHWLEEKLKQLSGKKVLVITAHAETALDLTKQLKTRAGIHAAVFHEQLSIVERDRAAAFFADHENGAQVLVCSEIGSEGRNFQFAHHMVLFDLPLNPDLLEQRIGRLDRIGQTQTIQIHVPYIENTAQEIIFNWYHHGLSAFEHTCPAGHSVFAQVKDQLIAALKNNQTDISQLVETTHKLHNELNQAMHRGRDILLEYNSCRTDIANALKENALIQDKSSSLYDYMENIFDCFNISFELLGNQRYLIEPSDHMISSFPGLPEDGMNITFDRDTALSNEDAHFLSWEHPLVINAMDMVLTNEKGNTAVTAVEYKKARPGTLLLECLFVLEASSSTHLQSRRYLPPTTLRVVLDEHGKDHEADLQHYYISKSSITVNNETAIQIIKAKQDEIRKLINESEAMARQQAPDILATAHQQTKQTLEKEINRLKALKQINPSVRDEEIRFFEQQWQALTQALDSASLRLDSLRVIVAT
ncbi:MAG: RNA polymerase-associated protein RapA [Gammaproteobacteria bacterium]|nr:RNA polymerase-associated protein RapA [Gammaproteobacteria bacterium]MDH5735461.1 RNA polymerase-associated protein RapA [Gammaproteobacteria bacterium]